MRGMRKTILATYLLILFLYFGLIALSYADDAEVLPKGVFNINVENKYYFPITERFNHEGNDENVATDFNETLGSNVFPDFSIIEQAFGLPAGSGNIGKSVVSFRYEFDILDNLIAYGITDRLTAGIRIPYWWSKNKVNAQLDATTATLGKNPFFGTSSDPFGGSPLIPISFGGIRLNTEDVQAILGKGLFINGKLAIPGFGYKRFKTWSDNGVGDIEAGVKYQYLKTANWRLAFTGGVRFPTGKIDDPDNLVDYGIGSGAYALLFRLHNDYMGIKNLILDLSIKYDLILPDSVTLRITDIHHPITAQEEGVDRNLGDIVAVEPSMKYEFLEGLSISLLYRYAHTFKDFYHSGNLGEIQSLELETDNTEHVFIGGLSYSTLPLYMEKKFPLPLTASLSYRERFAGTNNLFESRYLSFLLQVYF